MILLLLAFMAGLLVGPALRDFVIHTRRRMHWYRVHWRRRCGVCRGRMATCGNCAGDGSPYRDLHPWCAPEWFSGADMPSQPVERFIARLTRSAT